MKTLVYHGPHQMRWEDWCGGDVAFNSVGIPPTFDQAIQGVRQGGFVVAIGGRQTVPLDLARFVVREIRVHDEYYAARGWDLEFGWPQDDLLRSLGLDEAIPEMEDCRRRFADTEI